MSTYKQLTQEQRYFIYQLNKINFTQSEIASEIGVHKSTVNRELKRNVGNRGYRPQQAHNKALDRRLLAAKAIKMTQHNINLVEEKLLVQWSPEQVSGWLLKVSYYVSWFYIIKAFADFLFVLPVSFSITIIQEILISAV